MLDWLLGSDNKHELQQLRFSLKHRDEQFARAEREVATLKTELAKLRDENDRLKSTEIDLAKLEAHSSQAEISHSELKAENATLREAARRAEAEFQEEREIAAMQARFQTESAMLLFSNTRHLLRRLRRETKRFVAQQSVVAPWLARSLAAYAAATLANREMLLRLKRPPAKRAADEVSNIKKRVRLLTYRYLRAQQRIAFYEQHIPQLREVGNEDLEQETIAFLDSSEGLSDDPLLTHGLLNKDEYLQMPPVERHQLALDRYREKRKTKREIGALYEEYVGYLYECDGWAVVYHGLAEGLKDFGRDLICSKGNERLIVQCKCWGKDKVIRERHVLQLFATTTLFRIEQRKKGTSGYQKVLFDDADPAVNALIASTIGLSDEASFAAKFLGIDVRCIPLEDLPMPLVKCNVNETTGEKIYHLPCDQQYFRTRVNKSPDELRVWTCREAEDRGFRRAARWRGRS